MEAMIHCKNNWLLVHKVQVFDRKGSLSSKNSQCRGIKYLIMKKRGTIFPEFEGEKN